MRKSLLALVLVALAGFPVGTASAAPQALALMATNGAVPLTCVDGTCSVELSTFCLQQDRDSPRAGVPYRLASATGIRLVASDGNGRTFRLPIPESSRISAERGYWAVTLTLPEDALAGIEAVQVAVEVGENVSLLPVATLGDLAPQGEAEAAVATGPWRRVGSRVVDGGGPWAETARLTNRMINWLPQARAASAEEQAGAWSKALASAEGPWSAGVARAKAIRDYCLGPERAGRQLRQCPQQEHDLILTDLTGTYWKALSGPGS